MSSIYIVSDNAKMQKKGDTIQLHSPDGTITTIFPYKTEQLIIIGSIEITGAALRLLMRYNLDTIFLGKNGRFNGKLVFQESKNVFFRQKQFKLLENTDFRLQFGKAIVISKLKNQLTFMQRIRRKRDKLQKIENAIINMKDNIGKIEDINNLDSLRGHEGIGARYFFSVFKYNIIQDWANFKGRTMHPPQDNVNAVLSFLYTMLFFRVDGLLESEGLDSYVGYFHTIDYGKRSLAFDLMEEYRTPVADTLCCALFNLGILDKDDFREVVFSSDNVEYPLQLENQTDNGNLETLEAYDQKKGVLLTKNALKKVISQFEKKLLTEVYYPPLNKHISYKRIMREQINHFKRVINGEEINYKPLVTK